MSKKIYLDLTKEEKNACNMQWKMFLLKIAIGAEELKNFPSPIMSEIFIYLADENYIEFDNIRIFTEYCYSMTITAIQEIQDNPHYSKLVDDLLVLQELALKLERKVLKGE
jgi:hypothetical protein